MASVRELLAMMSHGSLCQYSIIEMSTGATEASTQWLIPQNHPSTQTRIRAERVVPW